MDAKKLYIVLYCSNEQWCLVGGWCVMDSARRRRSGRSVRDGSYLIRFLFGSMMSHSPRSHRLPLLFRIDAVLHPNRHALKCFIHMSVLVTSFINI